MQWVMVPSPLRSLTGGEARVRAQGKDILELLDDLDARYPGFKERICLRENRISDFINVFVNGTEVRSLAGARTPLKGGDEVAFIPAMAGGGDHTGG